MFRRLTRTSAVFFSLCLIVVSLAPTLAVFADSYEVTASVDAPMPPDVVPVITNPGDQTVVTGSVQTITGTCFIIVPNLIVVLERDAQTIGSGQCSDKGTFSIAVPLVLGVNVIKVKFMTVTGQVSGYGTPITLTYEPPTKPNPAQNTATPANTPASSGALAVNLDYDVLTYIINQDMPVKIDVSGGQPPYKIFIGWADNSSKTLTLQTADSFIEHHVYRGLVPKPAKLVVKAEDAAGNVAQSERALVNFETTAPYTSHKTGTRTWWQVHGLAVWSLTATGLLLAATLNYKVHFLKKLGNKRK